MSTTATRLETGTGLPPAGDWVLDRAHSSVEFVARHMMVTKVRGNFAEFDGRIHVGDSIDDSWAEATIKTASISTNMGARDEHLRSADFLQADDYPEIKFRSTSATHQGDGRWKVTGDLTIKDVTRPIELDAEFLGLVGEVAHFSATGEFDRDDFGITWNQALEGGGWLVSKKVRLEIQAEAERSDA